MKRFSWMIAATAFSFVLACGTTQPGDDDDDNASPTPTGSDLQAPQNVIAQAVSWNRIVVQWEDHSDDEDGFVIEVSTDDEAYGVLATVGADIQTFTHDGLTEQTTFWYRVYATRGEDQSNTTPAVSATTLAFVQYQPLSSFGDHTLLLASEGEALSWGRNDKGQLGNGSQANGYEPTGLIEVGGFSNVAAGTAHSVGVRGDGTVWAWGSNSAGQLGSNVGTSSVPTVVPGVTGVVQVAAGGAHTVALSEDGTVHAWGSNVDGQLGQGSTSSSEPPEVVPGLPQIVAVASGQSHTLGLDVDGTVWSWGANHYGQLGTGSAELSVATPTQVSIPDDVIAIAAGAFHSMALTLDGTVYTWGRNLHGELGLGGTADASTPQEVTGLTEPIIGLSAGDGHTLALTETGTLWSWGWNHEGQLGRGDKVSSTVPVEVLGLTDVDSLAAGATHSVARTTTGELWTWGANSFGQLGNGSTVDATAPIRVFEE